MSTDFVVFIALGTISIVYAIVLNTRTGKKFADDYTWASVAMGDSLVLAALWFIIPTAHWLKAVLAFAVAGTPMIVRSLLNRARKS